MYTYRHKERHILLNANMEYLIMQMVCGHEIGHDTLSLIHIYSSQSDLNHGF